MSEGNNKLTIHVSPEILEFEIEKLNTLINDNSELDGLISQLEGKIKNSTGGTAKELQKINDAIVTTNIYLKILLSNTVEFLSNTKTNFVVADQSVTDEIMANSPLGVIYNNIKYNPEEPVTQA